jgi:hypothetical protein
VVAYGVRVAELTPDAGRMRLLAVAYGVEPFVDTVADAIAGRTNITAGASERGALIAVVTSLVGDDEAWAALIAGQAIPGRVRAEMGGGVTHFQPSMAPAQLIATALTDIASVLHTNGPSDQPSLG